MKKILLGISLFLAGYAAGLWSTCRESPAREGRIFTVTVRDTVLLRAPAPTWRTVVRHDTVYVAKADGDTCRAVLPVEQTVYSGEGYRAYVSGFRPRLDSLRLERRVEKITAAAAPGVQRRWSVGIQTGIGLTPHGIEPYVGLGVSYRLY